jgi:hypothetical protein
MATEVIFTDEVIAEITATLPPDTDPARLAVLPELLRAWANEDLRENLSWEGRAEVRRREKKLRIVGAKAQDFLGAFVALDRSAFFDTAIEPQMLRDGTSLVKTDVAAAKQRRDSAIEWLIELAVIFKRPELGSSSKQKRPPDKAVCYYLIVRDLAAIYKMITERPATRRVDLDGKTYGPFSDFVKKVWSYISGNEDDPSYPIRVWANEMSRQRKAVKAEVAKATAELSRPLYDVEREAIESRFRENSTFAANLGLRHLDLWRKLTTTNQ